MDQNEKAFIKLQRHLDRQAVGFPATRSGVEIKLLKHIFSPKDAEIATCLRYRPEPLEKIFERAKHMVKAPEELAAALECIHQNCGIHSHMHDGRRMYCNIPLVIGMYEAQTCRMTPEFVEDYNQYTRDRKFGVEFLSTDLPQMRTIPVNRSISPQHRTRTFDEVTALLEFADPPIVILECICREKKHWNACEGCGICSKRCQMGAATVDAQNRLSAVLDHLRFITA